MSPTAPCASNFRRLAPSIRRAVALTFVLVALTLKTTYESAAMKGASFRDALAQMVDAAENGKESTRELPRKLVEPVD
jgi:hypothetical protein